jgi:hypothetical protein
MEQVYRRYCQAAAVAFVLVTGLHRAHKVLPRPPGTRLGAQRPAPVLGLAGRLRRLARPQPPTRAGLYMGGRRRVLDAWSLRLVTRGLLLGTPLAIPLRVPENLFHLLLSVPALAIVLIDLRTTRSHVPERG